MASLSLAALVATLFTLGAAACGRQKPEYDEIASVGPRGETDGATSCSVNPDAAVTDGGPGTEGGTGDDGGAVHVPSGLDRGGGSAGAGPYVWRNVAIRGGGFVSGLSFSPVRRDVVYARTDVGGAYRWDAAPGSWVPMLDWIDRAHVNLTGIESIVADPVEPEVVYIAAGTYLTAGDGVIMRSADGGRTFVIHDVPIPMGGNVNGRSMGERLAVDPNQPRKLLFGTRTRGLWTSTDAGESWSEVLSFPATGDASLGLSFAIFDGRTGTPGNETPDIYVGVASTRICSNLFRSTDGGATFALVPGGPVGQMPHHAVLGPDGSLVLTYNNGPGPNDITAGAVWRFQPATNAWSNITPPPTSHGFGGVAVDPIHPEVLLVSTLDWWAPDEIYRSLNGGATWKALGPRARRDIGDAAYLYFGRSEPTATGWMGDIEIDPFDRSHVLYITGQGIWGSDDVDAADRGQDTHWSFRNLGLEETVALDLVSPPEGAPLLTGVGDLAGFRHDDVDVPPSAGMFTNPIFQNTTSLDFAQASPSFVARVGRARMGTADRRGAYSTDGGTRWTPFASEPQGSGGEGVVAVSADGETIVWAPRNATPALSANRGATWTACAGLPQNTRPVADRVNARRFYAYANGQVHASGDGGATFSPTAATGLPTSRGVRLRAMSGAEGDLWLVATAGLFHSTDGGASFTRVPGLDEAYALGFGQAAPGASSPTLFASARRAGGGASGLFRSDDGGESWVGIGDPDHALGQISVLSGDPRRHGRVYLGTGGRGIIYGDPRP